MTKLRNALLLLAVAAPVLSAQTTTPKNEGSIPTGDADNGIHSMTMLMRGVTPRAVGLGEAMAAVEGDPSTFFYNTAGIARIKTNSFIVAGSQGFGSTQLVSAVVTFPTTIGTFGIGARGLNEGTIEETQNYQPGGRLRAYQFALEGGGAIQMARHWLWGGTLFYGQETLGNQSAGTIGINSSMLFPDIFGRLTLGGGVRNWGTVVTFDNDSKRPPLEGYGGAAIDLLKHRDLLQTPLLFRGEPIILDAKLVGQVTVPDRNEIFGQGGIEATINGVAIGRIGYVTGDDNRKGISLGAGVNVGQFRLEYAFRNRINAGAKFYQFDPIGDEHHVAATYFWGGESSNTPTVPVILTQPIDTAAINAAVRDAVDRQLAALRPLLDSLRSSQVEVRQESDLVSKYVVPVHFAFDSAVVRDTDFAVLGQIADVIRRVYPTALVTIEGFADPSGKADYNLKLSRRRAEAVRDVMTERFGLPTRQFKTVGYGEQQARQVEPGAKKDQPGALSNRRVVFTIDATQRF